MTGIMRVFAILNLISCWPASAASGGGISDYQNPPSLTKPRAAIGILVDVSHHQAKVIDFEREVVNAVLSRYEKTNTDSFVMGYSPQVELLQDWFPLEAVHDKIRPRIELNPGIGKSEQTVMYNALYAGLTKLESRRDVSSRILIVVGEGNDSGSTVTYPQIKKLAVSAHVQCFALLVADHNLMGGRVRHFGFYLYFLAGATKGGAYDLESSRKHLDKAISRLMKKAQQSEIGPPKNPIKVPSSEVE